jgi:hypothetical protein|uniref:MORN repeat-containing protein 5 n=1 Tax=Eutreptiella gymnastica TaxID=73025 RepID=A0A7S4GJK2_9EUGL|mmetsp:Transcript_58388/g.96832  ORF Transcript_58388/g.96832 Transcript_58388/m.96832 type:complete len:149 (-) Transcript_58388:606-1052(-)|eukprot:CAMPEP_0174285452 /NCGR_PEP_ID=MMETSP0809-20121228/8871_1 /TAXON_ID=73025 ORGANISM="Eutreptiella gymnastica-like, Strain CCMP1594" /NCGR_SAMPLE_ID=MMETSP0809 /ASSEMBLY_ACC=CAM_ASM_000658 /LENGTH=148 /DNA_ID=CAMNT_0015381243 /DNA_START=105 /DNA_END=551 /DNA_ORIENTATION=-
MSKGKKKKEEEPEAPEEPLEGCGAFVFDDGSRYEGNWIKEGTPLITKRKGYGVYKEGNNKYEGYWDDDKMSGEGTMFFASGAVYTGTWLDNCFDGKGKYSWTDSSFYEGMWRSNKMHGEGMYQDSTGKRWHGKFYNGMGPGITLNTAV